MTIWILIIAIYRGGITYIPMESKEACVAAIQSMPNLGYGSETVCLNKKTGEVTIK